MLNDTTTLIEAIRMARVAGVPLETLISEYVAARAESTRQA